MKKIVRISQINVAQLLKESIGATRHYEMEVMVEQPDAELAGASPMRGQLHLLRTDSGILMEAKLSGRLVTQCSRCLIEMTIPVTVRLEEEFKPTVDVVRGSYLEVEEEDSALLINDQHILSIDEVLRQALLLETPMHPLCRPDCAGLCQTCGSDLNDGPCQCPPAETDPRWAELGALLAGTGS